MNILWVREYVFESIVCVFFFLLFAVSLLWCGTAHAAAENVLFKP